MDDEEGYASDQYDEEAEARYFEKLYYGSSSHEQPINNPNITEDISALNKSTSVDSENGEISAQSKALDLLTTLQNEETDSSSDDDLSKDDSDSSDRSSLSNIMDDKDRYQTNMEAISLLLTGNYPHSVLERAKKREEAYNHKKYKNYYSAASDDDSDESDIEHEPPRKQSKLDMILGISVPQSKEPNWFKYLPSDPKYWTIDPDDLYPDYYGSGTFGGTCGICELRGHRTSECTRNGPFCVICAKEGHVAEECPNRVCPVCLKRGHDGKCRFKHRLSETACYRCNQMGHTASRCPDLWRQYRFTTKPGPPVEFKQAEPKVERCFNCGRTGHPAHLCRLPSTHGQVLLNPRVTQFDTKDIFAQVPTEKPTKNEVIDLTSDAEQPEKPKVFDEPLYVSFTAGPMDSLPPPTKLLLQDEPDDGNHDERKNIKKNDRRYSLQQDSNRWQSRGDRRKTFGGSSQRYPNASALKALLSDSKTRKRRRPNQGDEYDGYGESGDDFQDHQDSQPSLFISNAFSTPRADRNRDSINGRDFIGFRGKSPRNSSFTNSGNRQKRQRGSSGRNSFVNKNHNQINDRSLNDSQRSFLFNHTPQNNHRKPSKSPNTRRRESAPYLKRIFDNRDKVLKAKKKRQSDGNSLPTIANSPYLKLIKKKGLKNKSSTPHKRKKKIMLKRG